MVNWLQQIILPSSWSCLLKSVNLQQISWSKLLWSSSALFTRTGTKTVLQQNKGQSRDRTAALCWLSTQQNLLPACTFSGPGKITLSTLSWQNDRGSFNGFLRDHWSFSPSLISVLPAKGDIIGSTQTQIVFSWIDNTTKNSSLLILEPVNTL